MESTTTVETAVPMKRIVVRKAGPVRLTRPIGCYCYGFCCCL